MLNQELAKAAGFELKATPINGGQALVYRAMHSATGNAVALKVFKQNTRHKQILREAASLASIDHDNIANFIAAGYIGDQAYVATQWIDGERLCDYLTERAPLEYECAQGIFSNIVSALAALHDRQIVHGDLSPANVMIKPDGTAVVIDFGLGLHLTDQSTTTASTLGGTPRYIAPEVILGKTASAESDQYSLAIIFYELITGSWPFDNGDVEENTHCARSLHHQLYTEPVPITEIDPTFDAHVDQALLTALNKNPDQRFDDVRIFMHKLESISDNDSKGRIPGSVNFSQNRLVSGINEHLVSIMTSALALMFMTAATVWAFQRDSSDENLLPGSTNQISIPLALESSVSKTCNLMPNGGFDKPLSDNFYQDANQEVVAIIDDKQISSAPALIVGTPDGYGLYGQIIPINPDRQYQFRANVFMTGHLEQADLIVEWLDSDWQLIEDAGIEASVIESKDSVVEILAIRPPESARFAVPTVFKNASSGSFKVDNLIFSLVGSDC